MNNVVEYIDALESALFEVLDGESWHDIINITGLDEARCREIAELVQDISDKYQG